MNDPRREYWISLLFLVGLFVFNFAWIAANLGEQREAYVVDGWMLLNYTIVFGVTAHLGYEVGKNR